MKTILFDRISNKVKGIDREKFPHEYSVLLPYPINLNKTISESTNEKIQKVNENDEYLYKDNIQIITDEFGNEIETYDETIESEKVIEWDEQTVTYRIASDEYTTELQGLIQEDGSIIQEEVKIPVYQEITNVVNVPKIIVKLEPVMIDQMVGKNYTLENGYMEFDVLEAKKQSINNNNLLKIVAFDEDFLDSNLNLSQISIGDGVLILHGNNAELTTSPIQLPKTTNMFQIYLEAQPDITVSISGDNGLTFTYFDSKGKVKLSTPTDNVIVKFTNTATTNNSNREIYCYALLA